MGHRGLLLIAVLVFLSHPKSPWARTPQEVLTENAAERVSFTLEVDDVRTRLPLIAATVMPGEVLTLQTLGAGQILSGGGTLTGASGDLWDYRAPDAPGIAHLSFAKDGEQITVVVFILTPFRNGEEEFLEGYRIGRYAAQPFRGLHQYKAPRGFIRMTSENAQMPVSPRFTLGQFVCKQQPDHDAKFLLVRPATLNKLEALLDVVQDKGHAVNTLHVMSGFRTPWYNASIGNRTTSSRHLFGGAADVFVDADGDHWMDDLNGDGSVNKADAELLAKWAEEVADTLGEDRWVPGGIGVYAANSVRGPFVHVDARGFKARW